MHAHIEETIFYPALKKAEESRDITLEAYEEHKVARIELPQISLPLAAGNVSITGDGDEPRTISINELE